MRDGNPFYASYRFLCPLKTSEKQKFSDVFRRFRKRPVAWKGFRKPIITLFRVRHIDFTFREIYHLNRFFVAM